MAETAVAGAQTTSPILRVQAAGNSGSPAQTAVDGSSQTTDTTEDNGSSETVTNQDEEPTSTGNNQADGTATSPAVPTTTEQSVHSATNENGNANSNPNSATSATNQSPIVQSINNNTQDAPRPTQVVISSSSSSSSIAPSPNESSSSVVPTRPAAHSASTPKIAPVSSSLGGGALAPAASESEVSLVMAAETGSGVKAGAESVTTVMVTGDLGEPTEHRQSASDSSDKLSTGAIVGIAVACAVVVLVLLALLARMCFRRRRRARLEAMVVANAGSSQGLHDMDFCDKPPTVASTVASTDMLPTQPHWGGYLPPISEGRSTPAGMAGRGAGQLRHTRGPSYEYDDDYHSFEHPRGYAAQSYAPQSSVPQGYVAETGPQSPPLYTTNPSTDAFRSPAMMSFDRLTITPPPQEAPSRSSFGVFAPASDLCSDSRLNDSRLNDSRLSLSPADPTTNPHESSRDSHLTYRDPHATTGGFRTPYSVRTADTSPATSAVHLPPVPPLPATIMTTFGTHKALEKDQKRTTTSSAISHQSEESAHSQSNSALTSATTMETKSVVTPRTSGAGSLTHLDSLSLSQLSPLDKLSIAEKVELATRIRDLPPSQPNGDWRRHHGLPSFTSSPRSSLNNRDSVESRRGVPF